MTEKSPLPQDFRDVEQNSIVGKASRGENLTHYVLAERMMQVEADLIKQELMDPKDPPNTLIYMLEGGFRGCLLYTSPSPRDFEASRMPSSA